MFQVITELKVFVKYRDYGKGFTTAMHSIFMLCDEYDRTNIDIIETNYPFTHSFEEVYFAVVHCEENIEDYVDFGIFWVWGLDILFTE